MSGGTRHRPLSGKVNRQVRLRLRLASEDALGALRASSRPTNTGLEVHVNDTCPSGPPRMRYVPMSVNGSLASQVATVVAPGPTELCTCARASSGLRPWASSAPFEGHHTL